MERLSIEFETVFNHELKLVREYTRIISFLNRERIATAAYQLFTEFVENLFDVYSNQSLVTSRQHYFIPVTLLMNR